MGVALVALPVLYLAIRAAGVDTETARRIADVDTLVVMARSVGLAAAVAACTIAIALPFAWLTTRSDLPARRLFAVLGALPLVIPSYVGALALIGALGPRGLLQQLLEPLGVDRLPDVHGFWGSLVALTLFTYPYVLLLVSATFTRMDTTLERAARSMGLTARQSFVRVTLPQLRPAIAAGGLLVALYVLSDFGVVSFMRYGTFTREIFVHYNSLFDREGAALLSLVLCVLTVLVLAIEVRARGRVESSTRRVQAADSEPPVGLGRWRALAIAFCVSVITAALLLPMGVLTYWLVDAAREAPFTAGELWELTYNSLLASGSAALLAVALSLPIAVLVVRYPGRLSSSLERLTYLGFALPGIVIALSLVFLATRYAFGLYQTLAIVVLAYVIRFLPQAVGSSRTAIARVNPRLESASRSLGHTRLETFRRITLPLSAPGVFAGGVLVFLTAMKELPATLILRPSGFDTLATAIWARAGVAAYSQAAIPALVLVVVSAVPLYLLVIARPAARASSEMAAEQSV